MFKKKLYLNDLLILLMPLMLLLSTFKGLSFASSLDEVAALLGAFALSAGLLSGKCRRKVLPDLFLVIGMILLGLLSNLLYQIVTVDSYIFNDVFAFLRVFLVYFGSVSMFEMHPRSVERVAQTLGFFTKWFIIVSFMFGLLNFVGVVKMSNATRYGIPNYSFFFNNPSQFGIFVGCALALYIMAGNSKKYIEIFGLLVLIMTAKGTSLIIVTVYVLLHLFLKRKIKWWHLALVGLVLFFVLRFQIESYILNDTAPRAILLYYGAVTAVRFFPLGSGFATYGSNMAAVHYSPLYDAYNFSARKALTIFNTKTGSATYLNDTYLGMILGEFGFIGTALFIVFIVRLWNKLKNSSSLDQRPQKIIIALFVCLCASFLMLGSIKNAPGQIMMFVFATYLAINQKELLHQNNT